MEGHVVRVNLNTKRFWINEDSEAQGVQLHDAFCCVEAGRGKIHSERIMPRERDKLEDSLESEREVMEAGILTLYYDFGEDYVDQMIIDEGDRIGGYLQGRDLISHRFELLSDTKKLRVEIFEPKKEGDNPYITLQGYMRPNVLS